MFTKKESSGCTCSDFLFGLGSAANSREIRTCWLLVGYPVDTPLYPVLREPWLSLVRGGKLRTLSPWFCHDHSAKVGLEGWVASGVLCRDEIRWMEEILHQLISGLSHYLVSTIQGGSVFLPSTVSKMPWFNLWRTKKTWIHLTGDFETNPLEGKLSKT